MQSTTFESSSSIFYHQGETTTDSFAYFCVMITHVLVKTVNTRGNGATLPASQQEQGGALKF